MPKECYYQRETTHSERNCPIVKRVRPRNKRIPTYPPVSEIKRYTNISVNNGYTVTLDNSNLVKERKSNKDNSCLTFGSQKEIEINDYTKNGNKRIVNSSKKQDIDRNVTKDMFLSGYSENDPTSGFPLTFNPRLAANMRHREKVDLWIQMVPVLQIETNTLESYCYKEQFSLYWEEFGFDESTSNEFERDKSLVIDKDYQLFLQEQKYGLLVRKMYILEERYS